MKDDDQATEEVELSEEELEEKASETVKKKVKGRIKKSAATVVPTGSKHEVIDNLIAEIKAKNANAIIGRANDPEIAQYLNPPRVKSTITQLDGLLNGGFPCGKFTVLYGPEGSCKTALALLTMAEYLRAYPDKYAIVIDAENSADETWYKVFGVDLERVIFVSGNMPLEDMINSALWSIKYAEGKIGFCLLDSLGAMAPTIEAEGKKKERNAGTQEADLHTENIGVIVRKIGQALRVMAPYVSRYNVLTMLIAHVYVDINNYGSLVLKGGNALKHWSHVRLRMVRRKDPSFEKELLSVDGQKHKVHVGFMSHITLEKSKVSEHEGAVIAIPFRRGVGFETNRALLNSAVGYGLIQKAGAWFKYEGESIGCGSDAAESWLKDNDLKRIEIEHKLTQAMFAAGELKDSSVGETDE